MTNYRGTEGSFAVLRGFVPEGLNEGSQAVYCLECAHNKARPVGYGLIDNSEISHEPGLPGCLARLNHTVPPGRAVTLWPFQAINCLATLVQSLRDKSNNRRSPIHNLSSVPATAGTFRRVRRLPDESNF